MSYLDEPLGLSMDEVQQSLGESVRDLLRERGCPATRLEGQIACALACGLLLLQRHGDKPLTRRIYVEIVEWSVSWAMQSGKLVS